MLKKFFKKHYLIIALILLSSFFRLYRINDYAEFLGDQGRDVLIVQDFLKNGNLFFIGPQTSIGNMYLGPYFYYLIAPALFLTNFNPIGPAILMALFGVATVVLLFYVSKYWFGHKVAIFSSFLYAISPVTIKYSNFSWNPNIMPFFALLFIFSIGEVVFRKKYKYLILAAISFIFAINSHFLALILLPVGGLFWLIHAIYLLRNKDSSFKTFFIHTLIAGFIFLISLAPQILFDIKHNGQNINSIISFFRYRETTVSIKPYKAIPEMTPIFNNISTNLFTGKEIKNIIPLSAVILASLLTLFLLSIKKFKLKNNRFLALNLVWLFCGLIGLGLYKQHLYNHYFGFLYPVIYLVIGYLLSILFTFNKFTKVLSVLIFVSVFSCSILHNNFFNPPNNQIYHAYNIANAIHNHTKDSDGKYNLALLAAYNDFRAYAPRYFLEKDFYSEKLLDKENYQNADILFIILDDPSRWPKGIDSDIWEINVIGQKKVIEEFYSSDNVKIYKVIKIKPEKI